MWRFGFVAHGECIPLSFTRTLWPPALPLNSPPLLPCRRGGILVIGEDPAAAAAAAAAGVGGAATATQRAFSMGKLTRASTMMRTPTLHRASSLGRLHPAHFQVCVSTQIPTLAAASSLVRLHPVHFQVRVSTHISTLAAASGLGPCTPHT